MSNKGNEKFIFETSIIFSHNSHDRPRTLINTVNVEKFYFPDAEFYLSVTEDGTIKNKDLENIKNAKIIPTTGVGWQLGCINCFYSSISKICEDYDNGIIVFSYDDVILRDYDVLKSKLELVIKNDLSYVLRSPGEHWGNNFFMMEVCILNIKHVKKLFTPFTNSLIENINLIPKDKYGHFSAETWLFNHLKDLKNGLVIDYQHVELTNEEVINNLINNLGYEHLKPSETMFFKKKN